MELNKIHIKDCREGLKMLPDNSVDCFVTSPPYFGLRNYGHVKQIGLEENPYEFVKSMVEVFTEARRVLKKTGSLYLNLGDSYSGSNSTNTSIVNQSSMSAGMGQGKAYRSKPIGVIEGLKRKELIGIPWRVAFALQAAGWYLREEIIWHKPNPMPESVTDRCTRSHEYIFHLTKSAKYYYDADAIKQVAIDGGPRKDLTPEQRKRYPTPQINGVRNRDKVYEMSNKRSVWTVPTKPFSEAHFATFPEELIVDCIKAGCPEGGIVVDPFMGAGTTALVAAKLNRNFIGFELNPDYVKIAENRLSKELGMFNPQKKIA